ncbi:uncharacterized protein FA14DRAFT_159641 [Meira miltonrushii]|uniref:BHLH domain-containing protein n=1 Tax=Meira miltonrushii TaxID=1280837 RepID=A0A316VJ81_9BASI|nr:uncharacterized protein FA14DRAFT_159641 [Meira miltonrushii]PWN37737.1 hypothetical protein FA14DRAFT_159641 [Meira miltonrushii]
MSTSRNYPAPPIVPTHSEGFIHPPTPTYWQIHNNPPIYPPQPSQQNGTPQNSTTATKKPVRDSKRRATHSQIERRRREKINDRLITLRSIVPACVAEIEERKRVKFEEEEEARKIATGEISANAVRGGKRKRNRRRAAAAAATKKEGEGDDKEEELGLHKLEVLTHTIDYIYQLQERILELETGVIPQKRRVNDEEEREDDPMDVEESRVTSAGDRKSSLMEEDEDEESSEAHLEMAEWKGIQVKPTGTKKDIRRPSYGRRSNSLNPSPNIFGSFVGESPLFSATASSSSASVYTTLTSPMMSLSAESPIMCLGMGSSSASPKGNKEQEEVNLLDNSLQSNRNKSILSTAIPNSGGKSRSPLKIGGEQSWRLPSPALSAFDSHQRARSNTTLQKLPNFSKPAPQHDDARLLLAFSTSPEVFRPTSAERLSTVHHETHSNHGKNSTTTTTTTTTTTKPFRMSKIVDGRSIVLDSAPGGTQPTSHSALLPSPPFLALDKSLENLDQRSSHHHHSD